MGYRRDHGRERLDQLVHQLLNLQELLGGLRESGVCFHGLRDEWLGDVLDFVEVVYQLLLIRLLEVAVVFHIIQNLYLLWNLDEDRLFCLLLVARDSLLHRPEELLCLLSLSHLLA